jgi:hypothetical protein
MSRQWSDIVDDTLDLLGEGIVVLRATQTRIENRTVGLEDRVDYLEAFLQAFIDALEKAEAED